MGKYFLVFHSREGLFQEDGYIRGLSETKFKDFVTKTFIQLKNNYFSHNKINNPEMEFFETNPN